MSEVFAQFLPIAMDILQLDKLPRIRLGKHVDAGNGQPTFGSYNPNNGEISLALADRHPTDILRTLAHELVHFAQGQRNELNDDSGETGSKHENEANAVAGIIMRIFSKRNPDLIKSKPLQLKEAVTVNYGIAKIQEH
jgi:Zn-dependent peptidase ImmA (M78 family)